MTIIGIIFAVLALGFLIFIHELGHYWMARRVGMRVETFSIGFGAPLYSWERDNGERWQVGWLPFGGYVKIAGMEKTGTDPYNIKDGFFGKSPWDRIKVAFMGPFVNILFAAIAFFVLWSFGGRDYYFGSLTSVIGWVDRPSELFQAGVRPGDEIIAYDENPFESMQDHLLTAYLAEDAVHIKGLHNFQGESAPFEYTIEPFQKVTPVGTVPSLGIGSPATFIYFNPYNQKRVSLPEGSPMLESGLQPKDLIVWADGEVIYSMPQLSHVINENRALVTVQRGKETFLRRVPKVLLEEIRLSSGDRDELLDWKYAAHLDHEALGSLWFLPYNVDNENLIEFSYKFIDKEDAKKAFPPLLGGVVDEPLQEGDKILAVDGTPITYGYQLLKELQTKKVLVMVYRDPLPFTPLSLDETHQLFKETHNATHFLPLLSAIGVDPQTTHYDNFHLLKPIVPKSRASFPMTDEEKERLEQEIVSRKKELHQITDQESKAYAKASLEKAQDQQLIGLGGVGDRPVAFNPSPLKLFNDAMQEIGTTLSALFFGQLNPKHLSGPVGIVQVISSSVLTGINNSLWWLGMISLNLAILNLLPLPVLDGGSICLSFFEMASGRRLSIRALERLIIPFALLLIGALIWFTYNDILRLVTGRF